jgi:hypothetical protein
LLRESVAFSRLQTIVVLGLEALDHDAESLSKRKGYNQGGILQFRIMTGRSYFQGRNDGIVSITAWRAILTCQNMEFFEEIN